MKGIHWISQYFSLEIINNKSLIGWAWSLSKLSDLPEPANSPTHGCHYLFELCCLLQLWIQTRRAQAPDLVEPWLTRVRQDWWGGYVAHQRCYDGFFRFFGTMFLHPHRYWRWLWWSQWLAVNSQRWKSQARWWH